MTYLILAQTMIRQDKPQAMYRLGISEEVATILRPDPQDRIVEHAGVLLQEHVRSESPTIVRVRVESLAILIQTRCIGPG